MDESKVSRHAGTLFRYRHEDVAAFWKAQTRSSIAFMKGTAHLLDGEFEQANKCYETLPLSFPVLYNKMLYHREAATGKAPFFEKMLKQKHAEEFFAQENAAFNNKIAYFVPHMGSTGGMRMIMKQQKTLRDAGYDVTCFAPYPYEGVKWEGEHFGIPYKGDTYVWDEQLKKIAQEHDVAISPYFDHNFPIYAHFKKTFYYAQGDYGTFSDEAQTQSMMSAFHQFPMHIYGVSEFLSRCISEKYGRKSFVAPCSVDLEAFYPGAPEERFPRPTAIVMGYGFISQKAVMPTIGELLEIADKRDLDIVWFTPDPGEKHPDPRVKVFGGADQKTIAEHFRKAHVYVSGSQVESFSLPPLEAMASGTPSVAVDSGGINQYGKHGENCFIVKNGETEKLKKCVEAIIENPELRERMGRNGIETAREYTAEKLDAAFLDYFKKNAERKYIVHHE